MESFSFPLYGVVLLVSVVLLNERKREKLQLSSRYHWSKWGHSGGEVIEKARGQSLVVGCCVNNLKKRMQRVQNKLCVRGGA